MDSEPIRRLAAVRDALADLFAHWADATHLGDCLLEIIRDAPVDNALLVSEYITGAIVAIARLPDRSHIDDQPGLGLDLILRTVVFRVPEPGSTANDPRA